MTTDLQGKRDSIEAAFKELNALCAGEPFRMRIPVQDGDSDQIIGKALSNTVELVDEIVRLRKVVEAVKAYAPVEYVGRIYDNSSEWQAVVEALATLEATEPPA